jgi:hypothetical protein
LIATPLSSVATAETGATRYTVVLAGTAVEGGFALEGTREGALALVASAGGTVTMDLSKQIGVLAAVSTNPAFAETLRASANVEEVGEEFVWKALPSYDEALASGALTLSHDGDPLPGGGPQAPHADPLEPAQWNMELIRAPQAHATQAGSSLVEVGILDTGIDGAHHDFVRGVQSNVRMASAWSGSRPTSS